MLQCHQCRRAQVERLPAEGRALVRQARPPLLVAHRLESVPELAPRCGHEQQRKVAPGCVENGLGTVLTAGVE
eukprot:scaffold25100_cov68-Phaeocystis_antarctica.AAC.7